VEDRTLTDPIAAATINLEDGRLIEQLRQGDAEAGRQFVREYYPGVYRYLLYLTGQPQAAEDLTQETFVQAWRGLDGFEGRAPLRLWLHRIAHREFLQALRSRRPASSLEELAELPTSHGAEWAEQVELRDALRRLPVEERQIVVLHYLQGYTCQEIAPIVRAAVGTVKHRLLVARERLRRELGEGDLTYLNSTPEVALRHWAWLPLEALSALEARLAHRSAGLLPGDADREPGTTIARHNADWKAGAIEDAEGAPLMTERNGAGISRRTLLEKAGTTAAAVATHALAGTANAAAPPNESEVIDDRLGKKVALALKATALADLCE
jgi:RNA polymerase sigma-70 factor (ECF subfamily)